MSRTHSQGGNRSSAAAHGLGRRQFLASALGGLLYGGGYLGPNNTACAGPPGRIRSGSTSKNLIVMFLAGGAASQETFDPYPESPTEFRGPFSAIRTAIPGVQLSEHWPQLATRLDRVALLRAVEIGNEHSGGAEKLFKPKHDRTLGVQWGDRLSEGGPPYVVIKVPSNYSVYGPLETQQSLFLQWEVAGEDAVRPAVPFFVAAPAADGLYSGPGCYRGIRPGNPAGLADRVDLLRSIDTEPVYDEPVARFVRTRETGIGILTGGGRFFTAFTPQQHEETEYARDRVRYGCPSRIGDAALLARRLAERDAGVVVIYNERRRGFDLHSDISGEMPALCQETDAAIAGLLDDQKNGRGNFVLAVLTEIGRTPKINGSGGRDHWGLCCAMFSGGNFKPGIVQGRTTHHGVSRDQPVRAEIISNTIVQGCLGRNALAPTDSRVQEILV